MRKGRLAGGGEHPGPCALKAQHADAAIVLHERDGEAALDIREAGEREMRRVRLGRLARDGRRHHAVATHAAGANGDTSSGGGAVDAPRPRRSGAEVRVLEAVARDVVEALAAAVREEQEAMREPELRVDRGEGHLEEPVEIRGRDIAEMRSTLERIARGGLVRHGLGSADHGRVPVEHLELDDAGEREHPLMPDCEAMPSSVARMRSKTGPESTRR